MHITDINLQKVLNNVLELGTARFFLSPCLVVLKTRDTKQGSGFQGLCLIYCKHFSCCSLSRLYFRFPAWQHRSRVAVSSEKSGITWVCNRGLMDRDVSCLPFTHSSILCIVWERALTKTVLKIKHSEHFVMTAGATKMKSRSTLF